MAVNPNIALSVRGLELPDPLAQYGKVAAIQQAQQQNALAKMQMQQLERETQQRNMLNQAYSQAYTPEGLDYNKLTSSLVTGGIGSQIPEIEKQRLEFEAGKTAQEKAKSDLLRSKLEQSRSLLDFIDPTSPNAGDQVITWHKANHADPVIGPALAALGVTVETAQADIDRAIKTPGGLQDLIARSRMGLEKFMQFNQPGQRDLEERKLAFQEDKLRVDQELANLKAAVEREKLAAAKGGSAIKLEKDKQDLLNTTNRGLAFDPSDEAIKREYKSLSDMGVFSPEVLDDRMQQLLSLPLNMRSDFLRLQGATVSELKPETMVVGGGDVNRVVEVSPTGQTRTAAEFPVGMTPAQQEQARINKEQLDIAKQKMTLEERRVAQEELRNTPEFKQRMAYAQELGTKIARGDIDAVSQLPALTDQVNTGLNIIDQMIGKRDKNGNLLEGQAPHPGFESTVGATAVPFQRLIDGTPAADFMALYDQVTGQAFLAAFETLKGGGQITQTEGDKATVALNRMRIAQSEPEFIKAAMEFQDQLRKGLELGRKKAATSQQRMGGTSIPSTGRFMGFD
jgi:hypothetical protein